MCHLPNFEILFDVHDKVYLPSGNIGKFSFCFQLEINRSQTSGSQHFWILRKLRSEPKSRTLSFLETMLILDELYCVNHTPLLFKVTIDSVIPISRNKTEKSWCFPLKYGALFFWKIIHIKILIMKLPLGKSF